MPKKKKKNSIISDWKVYMYPETIFISWKSAKINALFRAYIDIAMY